MMGWQWHQLNHMQIICTSLQTDNHASTPPLSFFTGRMPFLAPKQQCQGIEGNNNDNNKVQNKENAAVLVIYSANELTSSVF